MKKTKQINNKRFDNIDLLKTIAIYFVILIHNFYHPINFTINNNIETYASFLIRLMIEGVLIFIFVNGFLLMDKQFDLKKHIKKMLNIFMLIITWSLIYTIIFSLLRGEELSLKSILSSILTTNISSSKTGILWFLQSLICLYLIFPIIKKVYDTDKKLYNYLFIIVLTFTVGSNLIILILQFICAVLKMYNLTSMVKTFINTYNPLANSYFILYFMFGSYVKDNIEKISKHKTKIYILSILSIIVVFLYGVIYSNIIGKFYSSNFNYNTIFFMISLLGLFVATMNYKGKNKIIKNIINYIGKNSLGIYFIHIIVSKALAPLVSFTSIGLTLLYGLFVLAISTVITYIISKIPVIKKLIKI